MSSPVRLSSVTFVHTTQAIEIFGNFSTPFGTSATSDLLVKFYGDCPRGTPPSGELNIRAVAKQFSTYRTLYLGNGARYDISYY